MLHTTNTVLSSEQDISSSVQLTIAYVVAKWRQKAGLNFKASQLQFGYFRCTHKRLIRVRARDMRS